MKEYVESLIKDYLSVYQNREGIETKWGDPCMAYADAEDKLFEKLKDIISSSHALPKDFLPDSRTVITYFIPFEKSIIKSNIKGKESSREWAAAYIETNKLIHDLNQYIKNELNKMDYDSTVIPATHNFDDEKLISDWSHKHVAYIAGLGNFGIHTMLITENGCAGRIGSIVTNLKLSPTKRPDKEYCLNKVDGSCHECVNRCLNGALQESSYNRDLCYDMCLFNDQFHSDLDLTDVCGKCTVDVPCSYDNPVS
ncbi:epoxyqueuosine reductase [Candidatus Bipolaricaulota bacterium]|nr:epoxyqueuosine reductase [Candidatus Bipolaricaulota bacterium]